MYIGAYMFLFGFIDKKVLKMGVQADGWTFFAWTFDRCEWPVRCPLLKCSFCEEVSLSVSLWGVYIQIRTGAQNFKPILMSSWLF